MRGTLLKGIVMVSVECRKLLCNNELHAVERNAIGRWGGFGHGNKVSG